MNWRPELKSLLLGLVIGLLLTTGIQATSDKKTVNHETALVALSANAANEVLFLDRMSARLSGKEGQEARKARQRVENLLEITDPYAKLAFAGLCAKEEGEWALRMAEKWRDKAGLEAWSCR